MSNNGFIAASGEYNSDMEDKEFMLREDYIRFAAAVHNDGARTVRDSAASMLPCCTLYCVKTAFALQRILADAESLMRESAKLGAGLIERSGLTKHTAVIEARMRLMGVELDGTLTQSQHAAERAAAVPPGTRADIYEGYKALSQKGANIAESFLTIADGVSAAMREGRAAFAVPADAVKFLHRVCADYGAACKKLSSDEEACLVRRPDMFDSYKKCLQLSALANGVDCAAASADTLAALAAGGLVPSVPAALFDILLRYEKLPPALC